MEYIQLSFPVTGTQREVLIAELSEMGCDAFEETDELLIASIPANKYEEEGVAALATRHSLSYRTEVVPQQNWNAVWEAGFEPVVIPGFCTVRASFHPPARDTAHEIVITPKMSFGTGHHATTRLMMTAMRGIDFKQKQVFDFGTGTGILAILAQQLGAGSVLAIDNDEWSVENARENVTNNGAPAIGVHLGSLEQAASHAPFDIILANINRHILLEYMPSMKSLLQEGGILLLSGILRNDETIIREAAETVGFNYEYSSAEGEWAAIQFTA